MSANIETRDTHRPVRDGPRIGRILHLGVLVDNDAGAALSVDKHNIAVASCATPANIDDAHG